MSRSHKKNHYVVDDKDRYNKRLANRLVRKVPIELTDTLNNKGYKRCFDSWDISDYSWSGDDDEDKYDENRKYTRKWRKFYYNK